MDAENLGICREFKRIHPQFDLHLYKSLPSTSTRLWKMIQAGAGAGTVVIAQRQSAGRGQRDRIWQSEPGGLYLSLALEPNWPVSHSAQLTCLGAWGIATALNNLGLPIKIKWPNDLFFEGKKLGGILTETKLSPAEGALSVKRLTEGDRPNPSACIKQAVIGVGINWHNRVPDTGITLAQILERRPDSAANNKINCLEVLAALVLKGILQGAYFRQQVGSQVFMKVYSDLLTQVGKVVSLDDNQLSLAIRPSLLPWQERSVLSPPSKLCDRRLSNRSGEVVGVSEEGYLQVAIGKAIKSRARLLDSCELDSQVPDGQVPDGQTPDGQTPDEARPILLFRPSEIHIS